jgi:hypothetical protein
MSKRNIRPRVSRDKHKLTVVNATTGHQMRRYL